MTELQRYGSHNSVGDALLSGRESARRVEPTHGRVALSGFICVVCCVGLSSMSIIEMCRAGATHPKMTVTLLAKVRSDWFVL